MCTWKSLAPEICILCSVLLEKQVVQQYTVGLAGSNQRPILSSILFPQQTIRCFLEAQKQDVMVTQIMFNSLTLTSSNLLLKVGGDSLGFIFPWKWTLNHLDMASRSLHPLDCVLCHMHTKETEWPTVINIWVTPLQLLEPIWKS